MKILFLTESLRLGGTPKHIYELLPELQKVNVPFEIWTVSGYEHYYYLLKEKGVGVKVVNRRSLPFRLGIYLIKHRKVFVHTFFFHSSLMEIIVAKVFGAKTIKSTRNEGHWRSGNFLESLLIFIRSKFVDYHLTNRYAGLNYLVTKEWVNEKRITIIPNGISDLYGENKYSIKEGVYAEEGLKLVVVQRLNSNKNTVHVLKILESLRSENISASLVIIGYGDKLEWLKDYCASRNLNGVVTFAGYTTDPTPYLSKADIMLSSSFAEGLSNSILEGIMMGLVCVVSKANKTGAVEDGINGFVFNHEDPDHMNKIVDFLRALQLDSTRLDLMKKASRRIYLEKFSLKSQMLRYYGFLRELGFQLNVKD